MNQKQLEQFPKIEKSIPLSKDDYWRLLSAFQIEDSVKETIMDLLIKSATKIEDRKAAMWDELARRFGYEDHFDARADEKVIEISWANRQINLRSSPENENPTT